MDAHERRALPEGWEWKRLGDVANIIMGQSPPGSTYNENGEGFNFLQGNAEFGDTFPKHIKCTTEPSKIAPKGSILMSVRAPVGDINIANLDYCIGRGLASISLIKGDNKYLFYLLNYLKPIIEDKGTGSTFKAISKSVLNSIQIPLPPLQTQRRIVSILEKAEETKRLRAQADELTDRLLKSVFLEMFGDLVKNPKGWSIKNFDFFAEVDTKMTTDFIRYLDYPHIGIENIERNSGKLINYKKVKEENLMSGKYIFTSEHIIYSKIRPNLNKVALPHFDGLCSADAYPLLVNKTHTNKYFFSFILKSKHFLDQILKLSDRTNIPKVNKNQLRSFKCICPSMELQQQFARIVEKIESMRQSQNQSKQQIEDLFSALMQKAFRGEI